MKRTSVQNNKYATQSLPPLSFFQFFILFLDKFPAFTEDFPFLSIRRGR